MKRCIHCDEIKDIAEFSNHRGKKLGNCRICESGRTKANYRHNKTKVKAKQNEYRLAHREEARAKAKIYYREVVRA